jgi:H+/Cl- antiporter ClcA
MRTIGVAPTGTKSFKGGKSVHRKQSNSVGPTGSLSLSERIGQKPLRYALVVVIGTTGALVTIGFYFMYLLLWNETFFVITHFAWSSFVCAALALSLSFMLVKQFAQMKTMGSGTHTVLETYHLKDGDITLTDTLVKPLAAVFTMGFGGSAGPEGPRCLLAEALLQTSADFSE